MGTKKNEDTLERLMKSSSERVAALGASQSDVTWEDLKGAVRETLADALKAGEPEVAKDEPLPDAGDDVDEFGYGRFEKGTWYAEVRGPFSERRFGPFAGDYVSFLEATQRQLDPGERIVSVQKVERH